MMKLFVWHNVLTDYTDGIMFSLAENTEQARNLILNNGGRNMSSVENDLKLNPTIYDIPCGFYLYGGG